MTKKQGSQVKGKQKKKKKKSISQRNGKRLPCGVDAAAGLKLLRSEATRLQLKADDLQGGFPECAGQDYLKRDYHDYG